MSTTKKKNETTGKARWAPVQNLGQGVKEAGRDVWLAGLGAVGAVDERGRGLFSDLVERGRRLEKKERPALEERFRKAGDRLESFRHKVEHGVEEKVASTLKRFGVPDRDEVQQLISRVEQLTRKVEGLSAKSGS